MFRQITVLGFLLLSLIGYSQKSTLIQNVNTRAKELKHSLNSTGDSLILEGKRKIYSVEIFNKDFERKIHIKDLQATIPLTDVPVGKFIVEATLVDKLIVMTLLRNEPFKEIPQDKFKSDELTQVIDVKEDNSRSNDTGLEKESNAISTASTVKSGNNQNSIEGLDITVSKTVKSYWIVYNINNGHNSQKIMRMANQNLVDRMISKNKIEMKTRTGKLNRLTIWEIYDTSEFMKFKRTNSNNLNSNSDSFNNVPYFKTEYILSSL